MEPTIKSLRQGSIVLMGKYSVDHTAVPAPISWTKATPNCDFISTRVLDYLCFDARENERRLDGSVYSMGNPNYLLSNINLFLNTADYDWYFPQHYTDNAPQNPYRDISGAVGQYKNHYGFLYYFDDFELNSILDQTFNVGEEEFVAKIRLPMEGDIFGERAFNLFKKHGIRAHPTEDFVVNLGHRTGYDSDRKFVEYYLADGYGDGQRIVTLDRTGYFDFSYPSAAHGIRPVCRLNPDTKVEEVAPGVYRLIRFEPNPTEVVTNEEIFELLGLVCP